MELGRLHVRGQNVNILHEALHPDHGIVWTDGKAIWKAPVKLFSGQVENIDPQKLGEFEQSIKSVHWSSNVSPHMCYLCVVHTQHISLWKVDGQSPKLGFKQVRKLNLQPIAQGCLWNPGRDILCVLSKQQCSFFYRHTQKKGSYAFPPVESGKINCGTWSDDGNRLVLCMGAVLLVYTWPEIDMAISNFTPTAWRIPGLDSSIYSVVSLPNNMVLCAAELPLESLCKDQNMFDPPDLPDLSNPDLDKENNEIISPKTNETSLKDTLLNLPRSSQNSIKDTSQLIALKLKANKEPHKMFSIGVSGLLTPDILHYEESLNVVTVGSNNQGLLQVFTFSQNSFTKSYEILLENNNRPKGISSLPYMLPVGQINGILVAVGKKVSTDSALPPSAAGTPMDLQLTFFPIFINSQKDENSEKGSVEMRRSLPLQSTDTESNRSSSRVSSSDLSSHRFSNDLTESESGSITLMKERKLSSDSSNLDSPRDTTLQAPPRQKKYTKMKGSTDSGSELSAEITLEQKPKGGNKIIDLNKSGSSDDLETESTDFSEYKPNFSNKGVTEFFEDSYEDKNVVEGRINASGQGQISGDHKLDTVGYSWTENDEASYADLQSAIKDQDKKIEDLRNRIEGLCKTVEETSVVFPTRYQDIEKPELVKVICQYEGDQTCKKKFVLDNGRLQLKPIKQAFNLATVELYIDGEPCVVGANIDGYIPVRFQPSSTLVITGCPSIAVTDQPTDLKIEKDSVI